MPTASRPAAPASPAIQAIAFDAFPIFDPRSIAALALSFFGERGEVLVSTWSARTFGYTWLATAAEHYESFEDLADKVLVAAADGLGMTLSASERAQLTGSYAELNVWPDVRPALERLKRAGLRLVFLSNLSEASLRSNINRSEIGSFFELVLSTDRVRRFKPSPAAYQLAMDALDLPRRAIGFAAFAGWDAVGASWFGYRTAWINRASAPTERLGDRPPIISRDINGVFALAGLS